MEENKQSPGNNAFDLKSKALNEMLSKPPAWIVRVGNTLFLFIFLLLLSLSWVIEYSEEVEGKVYVKPEQPPLEIANHSTGKIIAINISSGQNVQTGQPLIQFADNLNENAIWTTPVNGIVLINKILQQDKFYKPGEASLVIIPTESKYVAFTKLKSAEAIKVKKGQIVFIELENFPKNEFGMLNGTVSEITPIHRNDDVEVKVQLKNQLKTTLKKEIPLTDLLKGKIRIVTKKQRLLERLFESLINVVK